MRDLAAQVTSSLLCFPKVTVEALGEDEVTLDSVLHGKFTVGKSGLAWLACGAQLEVVHAVTGERFSAYGFSSGASERPPTVLVARDFCWLKRAGLLVGLEEGQGSLLCLYDLGISRVVKAVAIPGRITAIEPLVSYGGASAGTQHLHQSLRWFFGVAAVVTDLGHVLLVDLCLDDLSCSQSEQEAADLEVVSKSPSEIPRLREGVTRRGRHLSLQLCGPTGTPASALQYISRTNQIAVGFSDGYLQLWNMKTLKKEYDSQLEGGRVPVYAFTFQEPENDPRNCCYLWAVQSTQDLEGDVVSLRLLQLAFGERKCLASGRILYEGLEYCEERFSQDLSGAAFPLRAQATNTRLLSCQTIEKFRHHPDRDDSVNEVASPDTSVAIFTWQVKAYGQGRPGVFIGVFDINRWYHAQMPDSLRTGESLRSCPYLAVWALEAVVEMTSPCPLLDVVVHERSLSRGLPYACPPPEQFFNPTTYNFDASCLLKTGIVHLTCSGYQKETLSYLKKSAGCLNESVSNGYSRCLMSGLLSSRLADVQPSSLSQEEQLDAVLCAAVESSSLGLVSACIRQWSAEEQAGSAGNLRYILHWAWGKVELTKQELDNICAPLFDSSTNFTDPQTLQLLQHSQRLLGNLSSIFHCLLAEANQLTHTGLVGLMNKAMVSSLISQYAQVLLWFCRTGLLPEGSDEDALQLSRPVYSYSIIRSYYTSQRQELHRLAKSKWNPDCLMIDGLVAQCGERLADLWKRDEGGTGRYPPPSLHALLDIYLLENIEESAKHAIVTYLLLDVMYSFPNKSGSSVESFPTAFSIPIGLVKLVQGLWLLDHHDHESSLELLLHPAAARCGWPWQHERVLQALMCQDQPAIALRYFHATKPPVTSTSQAKLCLAVLLHNRCMVEAWAFLRQCSAQQNQEELLWFLYESSQELGLMTDLLKLPLAHTEQECLERYLQGTGSYQNRELLMVHYLQQANYVPALQLNQTLKLNLAADRDPKMKERSNTRNSILNQYGKVLPRAQRKLAIERAKPYQHPSTVLREVSRPQPLSTVAKRSATENVLSRAAFIRSVLTKIEEVWVGKEPAPTSSPLKREADVLAPSPPHPALRLPEAFVGTPITKTNKRMSRIFDLVVQPSSQSSPEGSGLLVTPPRSITSWAAPKSIGKAPELSLLQTPQVVKRARALAASGPVFAAFTPQSILRSSLRPTPVATPSASPGRSVTPPPRPKESRITFVEEAEDSPEPAKATIQWSNGIAAEGSPTPNTGMEAWSAHSDDENEDDEEEPPLTLRTSSQKSSQGQKAESESGESVKEVLTSLVRRPSLGHEDSLASVNSADTTLEFHDAPTPEDVMEEHGPVLQLEEEIVDEVVTVRFPKTVTEISPTPETIGNEEVPAISPPMEDEQNVDQEMKEENIKEEEPLKEEHEMEEPQVKEYQVEEAQAEELRVEEPQVEESQEAEPQLEEPCMEESQEKEPRVEESQEAEPQVEEPQVEEPQEAEPQEAEPQEAEPQEAEPQEAEPQEAEPQEAEPQEVEPCVEESQEMEPQLEEHCMEESQEEEPQVEEFKEEEPQAEEPQAEEPQAEEPRMEEPQEVEEPQEMEEPQEVEEPQEMEEPQEVEEPEEMEEPQEVEEPQEMEQPQVGVELQKMHSVEGDTQSWMEGEARVKVQEVGEVEPVEVAEEPGQVQNAVAEAKPEPEPEIMNEPISESLNHLPETAEEPNHEDVVIEEPNVTMEPETPPCAQEVPNHDPVVVEEPNCEDTVEEQDVRELENEHPAEEMPNHEAGMTDESLLPDACEEIEEAVPQKHPQGEEPLEQTDLDHFVEHHLFGNDLSSPLDSSGPNEASHSWTLSSSEPVFEVKELGPLPTETLVLTTQKSVASGSSEPATSDSHSVVSLNDSDEISSAASEEESEVESEEDSGSEVEIIEEVKGNGRLLPQQPPASLYLEEFPPHAHYLQEQATAVLSLVGPENQLKLLEEEEEEGEVVMVDLSSANMNQDDGDDVSYTELRPSATLLVPVDLAEEQQHLVDGGALPTLSSDPQEPTPGGSETFSLMLEPEDGDEMPLGNALDPSNHFLLMQPPEESEQPEAMESQPVTSSEVIYLGCNKQGSQDELEQMDHVPAELVAEDLEMPPNAVSPLEEEAAQSVEEQVEETPLPEPTKKSELEIVAKERTAIDLTEGQENGELKDFEEAVEEQEAPVSMEAKELCETAPAKNAEFENKPSPPSPKALPLLIEPDETMAGADNSIKQNSDNQTTQIDASETNDTISKTLKMTSEETSSENSEEASPKMSRKAASGKKTVTFPLSIAEAENELSAEERIDSQVPSKPSRVTRSGKPFHNSEVPVTPRRSRRKAAPDLQNDEEASSTAPKPMTPTRKTPQKSTPRKGSRRTKTASVDNAEDETMEESALPNEGSAHPGRQSNRPSQIDDHEVPETHPEVSKEKPVEQPARAASSPSRVTRKSTRGLSLALESFQQKEQEESMVPSESVATPPRSTRKTRSSTLKKSKDSSAVIDEAQLQTASRRLTRSRLWSHSEDPKEKEDRPLLETPLEVVPGTPLADALMERLKDEEAKGESGGTVATEIVRAKRRGTRAATQAVPVLATSFADPSIDMEAPGETMFGEMPDFPVPPKSPTTGRRTRASKLPDPDPSTARESFIFTPVTRTRGRKKDTSVQDDIAGPEGVAWPPVTRTRRAATATESQSKKDKNTEAEISRETEAVIQRKTKTRTRASAEPPSVQVSLLSPLTSPAQPSPARPAPRTQKVTEETEETAAPAPRMNLRRKRMMDAIFPKPVTRRKKF